MNVSIPYSWLKDYIKTNASVEEIAESLSLHSFSVEKIRKTDGDEIFEIEVTPNRGDALSVLGVARELRAVLPVRGFKCEWLPREEKFTGKINAADRIDVVIEDKTLVPRFSAIIMDKITFGDSPKLVKERLEKVGIRPLGNVIDVTNYMMVDKGQPMHVFDYDKIVGGKMTVRESREGEVITTLDGVDRRLPAGVIVIEDGGGRLIDLCGIMGAKNSEVDENTKKILLFVQVYDPVRIRRASMTLGHRTEAALRFEKGVDYEGVISALWESVDMIEKLSGAVVSSDLVDIVNFSRETKEIEVDAEKISRIAGKEIKSEDAFSYLNSLGFEKSKTRDGYVIVPSWRYDDINVPEDIAEEVIRLYGYYNLPVKLLEGAIPIVETSKLFYWEKTARYFLKYNGFFECYTYSATDKEKAGENALKISNPLNEEMTYLKTSLLPQLLDVLDKNYGYADKIKVFELASVYLPPEPDSKEKIPYQPVRLGIATHGVDYMDLKGIIEALFEIMGLNYDDVSEAFSHEIEDFGGGNLGAEINFEPIAVKATKLRSYTPLTVFNSIKEDLTFEVPEGVLYRQIEKTILSVDKRIFKLGFKDVFKNYLTLSIEYLDKEKQISSDDTQEIRKKIFKELEKIGVRLKV